MDVVKNGEGAYRVWGLHVVEEALRESPDMVEKVFVDRSYRGGAVRDVLTLARSLGIPVVQGSFKGKIGAQLSPVSFKTLDVISVSKHKLGLILDGITDEGNLGSIFRTAAAFGVSFALVPKRRVGSISPVVVRISQGGTYKLHIIRDNLEPALRTLKEMGYWIYATAIDENATSLYDADIAENAVFIMGREDKGVSRSLLKLADEKVYIPMRGMQSLNVAVATGIVLYEYRRRWR